MKKEREKKNSLRMHIYSLCASKIQFTKIDLVFCQRRNTPNRFSGERKSSQIDSVVVRVELDLGPDVVLARLRAVGGFWVGLPEGVHDCRVVLAFS